MTELKEHIESLASSYSVKELKKVASLLSDRYMKESGHGDRLVMNDTEALAYAIMRMPATYAAVSVALRECNELTEMSFASLLDVGAGMLTASFAASPYLTENAEITALEREPSMRKLGKELAEDDPLLSEARYIDTDFVTYEDDKRYDLVIASYTLNELDTMSRMKVLDKLVSWTGKMLLIVEPGTPVAHQELLMIREHLKRKGMHLLAPCPDRDDCPLKDGDWCHFTVRVERSRLHKELKDGDVPYEDEKYSYLAFTWEKESPCSYRILRHPYHGKGNILLTLCGKEGILERRILKKDKEDYKSAHHKSAGDSFLFAEGKKEK